MKASFAWFQSDWWEQGEFTMTITKFRAAAFLGALLFGTATMCIAQQPTQTTVTGNDNTRSSGNLAGGVHGELQILPECEGF
jgi:hypothetical protein